MTSDEMAIAQAVGPQPEQTEPLEEPVALTVAQILAAARVAHASYRAHTGRVDKDGAVKSVGNVEHALRAVVEARDLRQAAHDLDPEHRDPAWGDDRVSHESMMAFYQKFLS